MELEGLLEEGAVSDCRGPGAEQSLSLSDQSEADTNNFKYFNLSTSSHDFNFI